MTNSANTWTLKEVSSSPLNDVCLNGDIEMVQTLINSFNGNEKEIRDYVNLYGQSGWSSLHCACLGESSEIINLIISHGADRRAKNAHQNNSLHIACYHNKIEAVRALITSFNGNEREIREYVNLPCMYGWSALHLLCQVGGTEIIKILIEHGADRKAKSIDNNSPLHIACKCNKIEAVQALITSFNGNEREVRDYVNLAGYNGWSALHFACQEGDSEIINLLIKNGADIKLKSIEQVNSLHVACKYNNGDAVRTLIMSFNGNKTEISSYINLSGPLEYSALHFACFWGHSKMIDLLITHGADRKAKNTTLDNPLHIACYHKKIKAVRALITSFNGNEKEIYDYVNLPGQNRFSGLHFACQKGDSDIIKLLIEHGAERKAMDAEQDMPLHIACYYNKIEAVRMLISSFKGNEKELTDYINLPGQNNYSALCFACQEGGSEIINTLIEHGADRKANNIDQDNALHIACSCNKIDAVLTLIKSFKGDKKEMREYVNLSGENEWSALHYSCQNENVEIIKLLLAHGADVKAKSTDHDNPLHIACDNNRIQAVQALIASFNGSKREISEYVNLSGSNGWSALHFACQKRGSEIVKLLIAHGAERNAKNTDQETTLHIACKCNKIEAVRELITSFNGNEKEVIEYVNLPSQNKCSALHICSQEGGSDIIKLLIAEGADRTLKDTNQNNPLHIACCFNKIESVRALISSFNEIKWHIAGYVNLPGLNGWSALHCVCQVGDSKIVDLLIELGADRKAKNRHKDNPLHIACYYNKIEAVHALIDSFNGNDREIIEYVNLPGQNKCSALHIACQVGGSEIIKLLIGKGADRKAKSINQDNPLHIACYYNKIEAVRALITSFNGDEREVREYVNLPGINGWSALHFVGQEGDFEIINLLIEHGADRKAKTTNQNNPLHIFCLNNKKEAVRAMIASFKGNDEEIREFVNLPGQNGWSSLHCLSQEGHSEIVYFLIEHGADRKVKNSDQDNPLHIACKCNKIDVVHTLIKSFNGNEREIKDYINLSGHNGCSALLIACQVGDLETIKFLIANGADRKAKDTNQNNSLHTACYTNKEESVRVLITSFNGNEKEIREFVNIPGQNKCSALHIACQVGGSEIIEFLISQGADKKAKNTYQENPLHIACRCHKVEAVQALVASFEMNESEITEYVNLPSPDGWSPLHFACQKGDSDIINFLIEHGADIQSKNKYQDSALHIACCNNKITAVRSLITFFNGKESEIRDYVNLPGYNGWSALHFTCQEGHSEIVNFLLQQGADREAVILEDQKTPLHVSCINNNVECVQELINSFNGSKRKIVKYLNTPGDLEYSALSYACLHGHSEIVKLLLTHGADKEAKNLNQDNSLHVSCINNNVDCVQALITSFNGKEKKIREYINIPGQNKCSALHFACRHGSSEIIQLLIAHGADTQTKDSNQNNPLHVACKYNKIEAVRVLIASFKGNERTKREYLNVPGYNWWSALYIACQEGHSDIVEVLLSHGADKEVRNVKQDNPLHISCKNNNIGCVQALITSLKGNERKIREYINLPNFNGWSALYFACQEGCTEIIHLLIAHGADRNAENINHNNPLHIACNNNKTQAVQMLIMSFNGNKSEIREYVNKPGLNGWSALHFACQEGGYEIIRLLIAHGANRNAENTNQNNPLHIACKCNKIEAIRELIASFNGNDSEVKEYVNSSGYERRSGLHVACHEGGFEIIKLLIANGADRNAKNTHQNNPLHIACYYNKIEAVRALISSFNGNEREIREYINLPGLGGHSALYYSRQKRNMEIYNLLLAHGASISPVIMMK